MQVVQNPMSRYVRHNRKPSILTVRLGSRPSLWARINGMTCPTCRRAQPPRKMYRTNPWRGINHADYICCGGCGGQLFLTGRGRVLRGLDLLSPLFLLVFSLGAASFQFLAQSQPVGLFAGVFLLLMSILSVSAINGRIEEVAQHNDGDKALNTAPPPQPFDIWSVAKGVSGAVLVVLGLLLAFGIMLENTFVSKSTTQVQGTTLTFRSDETLRATCRGVYRNLGYPVADCTSVRFSPKPDNRDDMLDLLTAYYSAQSGITHPDVPGDVIVKATDTYRALQDGLVLRPPHLIAPNAIRISQ